MEMSPSQFGLLCDVMGVIALTVIFARISNNILFKENQDTFKGFNPERVKAQITLRNDGLFGSMYLVCGFTFQFFGTYFKESSSFFLVASIISLLMFFLYWADFRSHLINSSMSKIRIRYDA